MYDPSVGQFLSEDPIEFEGLDENLKRYVRNRSIDRTDPTGLLQVPPNPNPDGLERLPPPPEDNGRTPAGEFHYQYPTRANVNDSANSLYPKPHISLWNYTPGFVVELTAPRLPIVFDLPNTGFPTLAELDARQDQYAALAAQIRITPPKKANGKWVNEKYVYTIPCANRGTITAILRPKEPKVTFADGVQPIRDFEKIFKNPDLLNISGEGEFTIEWVR